MPSPFPGVDPYLEAGSLWAGVHASLIGILREMLVPQVRPRYFVDIEHRVYVLDEDDPARRQIVPDVALITSGRPGAPAGGTGAASPSVLLMVLDELEVTEPRLVVRDVGTKTLVTVIEVLSPTNKATGSRGRDEYLTKRREVLRSGVHLVEIDLLRAGARIPSADPLPACDYMAHVSRVRMRPRGEVFAWSVRDPASVIPVPLRDADADVTLDLGAVLRATYERGGYDLAIDYRRPPEPPLRADDAAWAATLLRERGLT